MIARSLISVPNNSEARADRHTWAGAGRIATSRAHHVGDEAPVVPTLEPPGPACVRTNAAPLEDRPLVRGIEEARTAPRGCDGAQGSRADSGAERALQQCGPGAGVVRAAWSPRHAFARSPHRSAVPGAEPVVHLQPSPLVV